MKGGNPAPVGDAEKILRVILDLTKKLEETASQEHYDRAQQMIDDRESLLQEAGRLKAQGETMDKKVLNEIVRENRKVLETLQEKSDAAAAKITESMLQRSIARYQQ